MKMTLTTIILLVFSDIIGQNLPCNIDEKFFASGTVTYIKNEQKYCQNGEWSIFNEIDFENKDQNIVLNKNTEDVIFITCFQRSGWPYVDVTPYNADIYYDDLLVYSDYNYSRSLMGDGGLNCNDMYIQQNTIAMRYGHRKDLLMVFAIDIDSNGN